MHKNDEMFILPNAWNVGSAYVFEKQGFKAVATTSAGIAHDLGYPDGEYISFSDLLWIVEKMVKRIDVPLSVDIERGYSEVLDEIKDNARKLLFIGAVGFNIEDGQPDGKLSPTDVHIEKIKLLSELKSELDLDFVINARTCTYVLNGTSEDSLKEAIKRCNAYAKAGADCVFIPGVRDEATVSNLVKGIDAPVNIMLNAALSSFENLRKLGVRRLSSGCYPVRFVYSKVIKMANALYNGNMAELDHDFSSSDANDYFDK